jgi:hypothetical protein
VSAATDKAIAVLGESMQGCERIACDLGSVSEDRTPYLNQQIEGKPIWSIVFRTPDNAVPGAPAPSQWRIEVLLDAQSGSLRRVVGWKCDGNGKFETPDGAKFCEMSAHDMEQELTRDNFEKWNSFADRAPHTSLGDAILATRSSFGISPTDGCCFWAVCVDVSVGSRGRDLGKMWNIESYGKKDPIGEPNFPPGHRQRKIAKDPYVGMLRHIVDDSSGKWKSASSAPNCMNVDFDHADAKRKENPTSGAAPGRGLK